MNSLMNFTNEKFGEIRGIEIGEESYLVGKDVVEALAYKKKYVDVIKQHIDEEDYMKVDKETHLENELPQNGETQNLEFNYKELGRQGGYLINESGFYALVFGSELPEAKEFKRWVTKEVLPQIRKTGGYIPLDENMNDDEIMARALIVAQNTINKKQELIKELQPKAENYKILMDSNGCVDFSSFVKSANLKIGRNNFIDFLRNKDIIRNKPSTEPYQSFVDRKYFNVIQVVKNGYSTSKTTITKKGVDWLMKKCKEWEIGN